MNEINFFLPTRKGSQRVKAKNTRNFAGIEGGILELKLRQLCESKFLNQVILSTNDEISMQIANKVDKTGSKIKVIVRPEELCLDSTKLIDLIKYVPTVCTSRHILWGHATTPLNVAEDYDDAIKIYFEKLEEGFDSLISVLPVQNFFLSKDGELLNKQAVVGKWPRTQDLPVWYEVNHAMFIASNDIYKQNDDRIGIKPFLYEQDKIKSIDIDWDEDFLVAETLFARFGQSHSLSK